MPDGILPTRRASLVTFLPKVRHIFYQPVVNLGQRCPLLRARYDRTCDEVRVTNISPCITAIQSLHFRWCFFLNARPSVASDAGKLLEALWILKRHRDTRSSKILTCTDRSISSKCCISFGLNLGNG